LKENKVDETAALKQMDKVSNLEKEIKHLRLKMLMNVKNNLTVDQQSQLKNLTKNTSNIVVTGYKNVANEDPRIIIKGGQNGDGVAPMYIIKSNGNEKRIKDSNPILDLNPDEIESVTVLKGKAAKEVYGKDAKNGVVVIVKKDN